MSMKTALILSAIAAVSLSSPVAAQPVPGAVSSITLYVNGEDYGGYRDAPGVVSYGVSPSIYGETLGAPDPTATASTSTDNAASNSSSYATLFYYFEVTGPGSQVAIDVAGTTSVSGVVGGGGLGFYEASTEGVFLGTNSNVEFGVTEVSACDGQGSHVCQSQPAPTPGGAYAVGAQSVSIGQVYGIILSASVAASGFDGSAYASIDPTITIDPSVRDPGAYQIAVSPGLDNPAPPVTPSGVPEPSSWALLVAGLGVLGSGLRRGVRAGRPLALPAAG